MNFKKCLIFTFVIFSFSLSSAYSPDVNFNIFNSSGEGRTYFSLFDTIPDKGLLIINFTSVNCLPCKKEIPELVSIHKKNSAKTKLIFVYAECCDTVKNHATSFHINDKSYSDAFGKIKDTFSVKEYPTTFILDKKHNILKRFDKYSESNMKDINEFISNY